MRYIEKSAKEPPELLKFRKICKPNCTWDDFGDKEPVRKQLLTDQLSLCCYCMQRIDMGKIKVEHYLSKSGNPDKQLDWKNLLASCPGGEGKSITQQTCDTHKGNNVLNIDPLNHDHMQSVQYRADGRIVHDSFQSDLDETLNLNIGFLKYRRQSALEGLKQVLRNEHGPKSDWPKRRLEKKLASLCSNPQGKPFLGLLEDWLKRRIRKNA